MPLKKSDLYAAVDRPCATSLGHTQRFRRDLRNDVLWPASRSAHYRRDVRGPHVIKRPLQLIVDAGGNISGVRSPVWHAEHRQQQAVKTPVR